MAFTTGKRQVIAERPVDRIFPGRREAIAQQVCRQAPIGCGKPAGEFRDDVSRREYAISGLCQACQDSVYNAED